MGEKRARRELLIIATGGGEEEVLDVVEVSLGRLGAILRRQLWVRG